MANVKYTQAPRKKNPVTIVRIYHKGVVYNGGSYATRYVVAIDKNTVAFQIKGLTCDITKEVILQKLLTKMHKLRPISSTNPIKEPPGQPDMVIHWSKTKGK